ncbi:uncharacterized protein CC84DRAFT_493038 [Paraphaeosphaeria sporulosa]|uniref:Uncharacterized protein n=1 Tax=Paraphaeosphaeria sporulosa TaxID=1460663 RepID=A0A177CT82_9PLEO|nr:uncharacterized protein CC84DRAFT_493038 [Paraphaeosphaeria sporulosa]OAG10745.1 hypothetical protein CC84DRAFT_493038 [Paraphaeosphaeria sporulosa]
MTDYMTQPGLSLPPSSRQDIVSALLNDYGSSFEDGSSSPYKSSPVSAFKELPPPPPPERSRARDYSNGNSSPAVQKMNTPFRLRVDVPASPESPKGSSNSEGSPSRIVSKRLKRRSIPRSLTLTVSNGSTAELPKSPTIASQPEPQNPFHTPVEEKALPPPPPEKSTRRQPSAMGNQNSTARSPRKDSLHSQDGKEDMEPVKRKPLPKFTSLADLGNGPRGGKGGPMPQPRARKQSFEADTDEERGRTASRNDTVEPQPREYAPPKLRDQLTPMDAPRIVNLLPPTPTDESTTPAPPPSSKKPFGGMGLPSNPRHRKGKSDTGFDVLNSATSPSTPQLPAPPQTITPGPTPTPRKIETMGNEELVDQAARFSPDVSNSQRRPFSFERVPTSPPPQLKEAARDDASINAPLPPAQTQPRTAVSVSPPTHASPLPVPPPAFPPPRSASRQPPPPAFASLPSQQRSTTSDDTDTGMSSDDAPDTPPFVPLTEAPRPVSGPPITHKHHGCYSQHATFVWSRNDFQPMACMICAKNDTERRWACVWCYLRICVECSVELQKTPGRRLQSVLERRAAEATYAGEAYEDDDEPALHPGFGVQGAPAQVNGVVGGNAINGERVDFS